jgi:hypothetical protein
VRGWPEKIYIGICGWVLELENSALLEYPGRTLEGYDA